MNLFIRLTYKGNNKETTFQLSEGEGKLYLIPISEYNNGIVPNERIEINKQDDFLYIKDTSKFEENEDVITNRLLGLTESYLEAKSQGMEITSEETEEDPKPGYSPDDIYVENKPFSIRQIIELIEQGDLDLAPNFQRHFVWDRTRQSLLIESILLGLPLPSIYLSQYPDGMLTVVDGLQRIHTIKNFMDNKLHLCNMEYLKECNDKTYSEIKEILSPLRIRKFGQTQLMCFVIDYRSPSKLKFDLFRRLNTGGKPLNSQEIRNCLSKPAVQTALYNMSESEEFRKATDNTVTNTRLQAQEAALRFLYFRKQYSQSKPVGDYSGKMDESLNEFLDELNKQKDFSLEVACYKDAMNSAYYLFGKSTFRKVTRHSERRLAVNKLLMLCLSVLLSFHTYDDIQKRYAPQSWIEPLKRLIDENETFYRAITYGTNSKWNIETAMTILRDELMSEGRKEE